MNVAIEVNEAIFDNAGQAVHVAFLVLAQEAIQEAPLRKALIRAMESIQLTNNQRNWLDELRGTPSGTLNFGDLDGNEVRAQCAMITQAVKTKLPKPEMWVLQAKYGQTDFEELEDGQLPVLMPARRRWAFSAERIEAIQGLSDWFQPLFPKLKPFAVDCLLGRHFANHKKLEISVRDIAASFGGSRMSYQRAAKKIAEHLRDLEHNALGRLEVPFKKQGVISVD